MINLEDCIGLGTITKTNGFRGHLVLKLNNLSFDDIEKMELVFILIDGLPVPFFIEEFIERNNNTILIKFDEFNTESSVKFLCNSNVFISKKYIDSHSLHTPNNITAFIGYSIHDTKHGNIGVLDKVIADSDNPLLVVKKGFQEILVPLQEEFILKIDEKLREITVTCPDGLLDLYT
jgi:16S rRNA processing protein RimM